MPAYYQRLTIDENDEPVLVVVLPLCHDGDKDLIDEADMTPEERSIDDLATRPVAPSPEAGLTFGELAFFAFLVAFLVHTLLTHYVVSPFVQHA